jgi:AraC-like DNA-binding protein
MKAIPIPRETVLPPNDRSFWKSGDTGTGGLHYLAWGERRFGSEPIPLRRHSGWVFTLICSGSAVLVRESGPEILRAGDAFIAGNDAAFGWSGRPADRCKFFMWMWDAPATAGFPRDDSTYFRRLRIKPPERDELAQLHSLCRREVQRADSATEPILRGCQQILEGVMLRARGIDRRAEPAPARLEFALRWLRTHLNSREPASRLGDYLGVSGSTLHRLFKRNFGESPATMVQRLRLETAQQWLAEGDLSIKEIAFRLGYRHFSDFSRAYKARAGQSPSSYRASARRASRR